MLKLKKKAKTIISYLLQNKRQIFAITNLIILPPLVFFVSYFGKIYPNVSVAQRNLSGLSPQEAITQLESQATLPQKISFTAQSNEQEISFDLPLDSIAFSYNYQNSVQTAYNTGRTGNILYDIKTISSLLLKNSNTGLHLNLDEQKLYENLSAITSQIIQEPIFPSTQIQNDQVIIIEGQEGTQVDLNSLRLQVGRVLAFSENPSIQINTNKIDPSLSPEQTEVFLTRSQSLVNKSLTLTFEYDSFSYSKNDLLTLIDPRGGYIEEQLSLIAQDLSVNINRPPQNPIFNFANNRVTEFAPAKDGISIKTENLVTQIKSHLTLLEESNQNKISFSIPVEKTSSAVNTKEVNDLGINELIGRGSSRFAGSISSRIYNVNLAANRLNGILIAPGDIFSFNNTIGDVSKLTGYKEAYVIKDGKTTLGDGGGLCQVSTTLFRAAMDSGLPITERRSHSYRVGYYEQDAKPGLDATVYSPTTDFKFKNDTPGHILIQAYPDTKNMTLVFEFYGTSDGRQSTVTTPVVYSTTAALAPQYTDDPSLPIGTLKQIDWAAGGAKSKFDYTVIRDGQNIIEKTFYSNYRPWAAKFLRGTAQ